MPLVSLDVDQNIALVTIDHPPVNALSIDVRRELFAKVSEVEKLPVRGAVLLCAGRTFVAGADIKEFGKPLEKPMTPDIITAIEASKKPWTAALHGTVLGGGLELVLGCAYRVAARGTQFGFPEVTLGIIPGAGGTQRLPRLVGMLQAIEIISSGRRLETGEALKLGLIDEIIEGDLRAGAVAFLWEKLSLKTHPRAGERSVPPFDAKEAEAQIAQIKKRVREQISPIEAANAVLMAVRLPLLEGLRQERAIFEKLAGSPQSRALRYQFFAEREAAKVPELEGITPLPFEHIGIIGAGTMGIGIAGACLLSELNVTLLDSNERALAGAREKISSMLDEALKRERLTVVQRESAEKNLHLTEDFNDLSACNIAIEAVFEDFGIKRDVLKKLDAVLPQEALIATNTSYLGVNELAKASGRPQNFLGLHFFAPAHIMKLLEIVHGIQTSKQALATSFAFAKRLKKIGVLAGAIEGFIGNRIWQAYRREIEYMLEDGASPYDVDKAMADFGFALGPFAVADLSGLDIAWAQRKRRAATRPKAERYVAIPDRLCEAGRLGRKTDAGWYLYENGKPVPDPEVEKIIAEARAKKDVSPRHFSTEEIQERVLEVMAREGAKLLEEGVAQRASDIDVVMVNGYGYPRWRGGPMFETEERRKKIKQAV